MVERCEALKMEAKKKLLRSRKPLSDCTNKAVAATSPSRLTASTVSFSFLKSKKSSISSDVKLSAGDEANCVASCSAGPTRSDHSEALYVSCANPLPLAASTTPVLLKQPSDHGMNDNSLEPHSFYRRKRSLSKKKHTEAKIVTSSICYTASKVQDNKVKKHRYNDQSQARTVPPKKKPSFATPRSDAYKNALPQDFIERQKAYFAEIDAFELPEEEVESVLELD